MTTLIQQVANGLVLGSSYALIALGLLLIFGVLHVPNFAHGQMYMLAALVTIHATQGGLPYLLAMLAGLAVVGVIGTAMWLGVFRPLERGPRVAMFIAALALGVIFEEGARLIWGGLPVAIDPPIAGVVDVGGVRIGTFRLLVLCGTVATLLAVWWLVYRTRFGRMLRAAAQNRDAAMLIGVNVRRVSTYAFAIGSMLAGVAGALLAGTKPFTPFEGFFPTLVAFIILILAGTRRLGAVVAGGFAVGIAQVLVAGYISPALQTTVVFAALILVLAVMPAGLQRGVRA